MVRGVAMNLDAGLLAYLRTATVGTDDQPAGDLVALSIVAVRHARPRVSTRIVTSCSIFSGQ
jgi:hypothetical protein